MTITITDQHRNQYHSQGYFTLKNVVPPSQREALIQAIKDLMERSIQTGQPELRWINKDERIPGRIGGILEPSRLQPGFADSLANGPYFSVAEQILKSPARYCVCGILAGGGGEKYIQGWHRDTAPIEGERELAVLQRNYRLYTQINAPLYPDRFLQIVPGSHLRKSSEEELDVLHNNPTGDLPGQITVELDPGDVVFYYNNLFHRGYNPEGELRWTMHHGFMVANAPIYDVEAGQDSWIGQEGYIESLPEGLQVYVQRYLDRCGDGPAPKIREIQD
ncbi:MAG: phytanoyl-CoA dioxygenase family protein [Planctomycetota bacterium]|nr:phytanoyl-CoA dioxygenase family protein [Planctomycetota bacterium]MDA1142919.1 phytanoyl-CoA dioxygenase family protein [Planctomycetota bacterium]